MKIAGKFVLLVCFILLTTINVTAKPGQDMTYIEIFQWVAQQLKVDTNYPFPQILIISKTDLEKVWRKKNQRSYQSWVELYGENKARETMDQLLDELLGLFDPKTRIIYVGNFMGPCKTNAILAHEITHYLQLMQDGPGDPESEDFDLLYIYREMQADQIEKKFWTSYCHSSE